MLSRLGDADRLIAMQCIGGEDVNRIDVRIVFDAVEILIVVPALFRDTELRSPFLEFGRRSTDEPGDPGALAGLHGFRHPGGIAAQSHERDAQRLPLLAAGAGGIRLGECPMWRQHRHDHGRSHQLLQEIATKMIHCHGG